MSQLYQTLSKLLPVARSAILDIATRSSCTASLHVHEHYHAHFLDNPKYKTVARSNLNIRNELLDRNFVHVNAAGLSDVELLEAILLCQNTPVFKNNCKDLDRECCRRISRFSFETTVQVMDSWVGALGNRAFRGEFFASAVAYWILYMKFATKYEFIHLTYLLGGNKSVPESLFDTLSIHLRKFLPSLTPKELAIVCSSFFKLKCKFSDSTALHRIACEAEKLMLQHEDCFDLIAVLKFFRMCKYYDKKLLTKLAGYILENCDTFNVTECAHFLAAYSSVNVYEPDVFVSLESRAFSVLKAFARSGITDPRAHPAVAPRIKDVAKILWALANVGHQISELNSTIAVAFIEDNFSQNVLTYVLDAIQSLAYLGVYPRDLMHRACRSVSKNSVMRSDKKKLFQQFVFVKNTALIMLSPKKAPWLSELCDIGAAANNCTALESFVSLYSHNELCPSCILPHIRIAGVALVVSSPSSFTPVDNIDDLLSRTRKTVHVTSRILQGLTGHDGSLLGDGHNSMLSPGVSIPVSIEVLDNNVLVRDSSVLLLGIMRAKVQQLEALGVKVVLLTQGCIDLLSELSYKHRCDWLNNVLRDCINNPRSRLLYSSENVSGRHV